MRDSDAKRYIQNLKSMRERIEKQDKIDAKLELKLRDLLQIDRLYDVIDYFSERGDFVEMVKTLSIITDIYGLVATKGEGELLEWAMKLAPLFKEKIDIEMAAINLQLYSRISPEYHETIESIISSEPMPLNDLKLTTSYPELLIERPIEEIIQETPISEMPMVIERELEEIVGPSKGKVLNKLLFQVLDRLDLPVRTDYGLQMRIGPNFATFKPDIVIFDTSNNLRAIIETVSNLTQRKAEALSLQLVTLKKEYPQVNFFVVYIKAVATAIEFMDPIVDGIYSVKDMQPLLEEVRY